MCRNVVVLLILAACGATAGTVPVAARAEVEKTVAVLLRDGVRDRFEFWEEVRAKGCFAARPLGAAARPALLDFIKDKDTDRAEKFVAVAVLTAMDVKGTHARELLGLLEAGAFAFDIHRDSKWVMALAHLQDYLVRFLQRPGDVERLCGVLAADETQLCVLGNRTSSLLPVTTQARFFPELLPRLRGVKPHLFGGLLAHVDYHVGGDAVRKLFLRMAQDANQSRSARFEAARAWASRCTQAEYEQVYDLLQAVKPWRSYPSNWLLRALCRHLGHPGKPRRQYVPSEVLETLAMLDWERAHKEFAGAFPAIMSEMEAQKRRIKELQDAWNQSAAARQMQEPDFGFRRRGTIWARPPKPPPPFPAPYYTVLRELGTEEQVREVFTRLVKHIGQVGTISPNGPEEYCLVTTGLRAAAPLFKQHRFPSVHSKLTLCFSFGLDPEPLVKAELAKDPPTESLQMTARLTNLRNLPPRLVRKYRRQFVSLAHRVLEGGADAPTQDPMTRYDAFDTLCRLAPAEAEKHIARFAEHRAEQTSRFLTSARARDKLAEIFEAQLRRHDELDKWDLYRYADALATVRGRQGVDFVHRLRPKVLDPEKRYSLIRAVRRHSPAFAAGELLRLLEAETRPKRRLDIAKSLANTPLALSPKARRQVEAELLEAMRHSAGAPRLDYAVLLALLGDKEGTAVYEAFLRGDWRPRTNYHSSFYALARFARGHPEPCAGRARRFLSRALTAHPDPNVRAYAIRACSSYLGARGAGGKGFFLIELLIPLLDPRTDWRVRCAAGLELRRAFREAHPSWDYYHFWPPEKQRQAANALAHWWKRHEGHVRWQPLDPGYPAWCGYFVLER